MPAPAWTPARLGQPLRTAALVTAIWIVLGVFLGTQMHINMALAGHTLPLLTAIGRAVGRYLLYALLTFPVVWLCRRVPFSARRFPTWIGAQALGLAGFAILYTVLRVVLGLVRDPETLRPAPPTLDTMVALMRGTFFEQAWMYASIVSVVLAIDYAREQADLRRRLAESRLQVLRLQLHPHFLFNAMNGIATLMQRDVPAARDMLLRLSDLLRIALSHVSDNETSLREEIEFVRAYLDLERMRFGDRLAVRLAIDPATLEARVPHMILQPLVENAIRHGIAAIRAGGALDLATARRAGTLQIRIVNDGPVVPAAATPAPPDRFPAGIGLRNARARLRQMYGDDWTLRLLDRPQGGATLEMELPLRTGAATAGSAIVAGAAAPEAAAVAEGADVAQGAA